MTISQFYDEFEFFDLIDLKRRRQSSLYSDLEILGIDKVYYSGDYPAIFFKEVAEFDDAVLKNIAEIQHLCWNYRKVSFLFVLSTTEVRIYDCTKKPFNYTNKNLDIFDELNKLEITRSDYDNLKTLSSIKSIFSRVAVDCGLLWTTENILREKVSIQERIDKFLVKSLLFAAKSLKENGLNNEIIHSLLMRSIFIMYLEDKGAAKETNLYKSTLPTASSYLDILKDKEATYTIFEEVESHFNGNVFPLIKGEKKIVKPIHLDIVRKCLIDGNLSSTPKLFESWRLFRFDIIQIELLSEIYEHFLEEFKGTQKEKAGQYYTPPSLVELILNEKLKIKKETNWRFKILDPACGSGIFLVESFKRLVARWKNDHPGQEIKFADLRTILEENIFGIEYDYFAIRVTAFSLYLAMLEQLNPRTLWIDKRHKFPYLIYDPKDKNLEKQGKNLIRQDTIGQVLPSEIGPFDLIVGNPPFGADITLSSIKEYCINNDFGQDMVVPFLHKAVEFSNGGSIALIFNTKILTNTEGTFKNFRTWLFNDTYVEKIYNFSIFRKTPKSFGGQLFSSAVGPVSILFYQKAKPKRESLTIEYWAPKTYVKNNLIEGIVIDSTDIKHLPRSECQNPSSKIWKIAMWGTLEDFKLISRLNSLPTLSSVLDERKLKRGVGIRFIDKSTTKIYHDKDLPKLPYIEPDAISRFYSPKTKFIKLHQALSKESELLYKNLYRISVDDKIKKIDQFRRIGKHKDVYYAPHVLVKSGLSEKKLCASYLKDDCVFNSKVLGISDTSTEFLKTITSIINSNVAEYYLFLISASIGIEREEVKPNEIYELPIALDNEIYNQISATVDEIINRIDENSPINDLERYLNDTIYRLYNLSAQDLIFIEDFININLSLLFDGHKSIALKPVTIAEGKAYGNVIGNHITNYLKDQKIILNTSIFEIKKSDPLNIIKITFGDKKKDITTFGSSQYDQYLSSINEYCLKTVSKSIYIQKQIKYFDNDSIYIIKPNQKRFWSRSMAINDANELINEILKMS